MEAQGFPCDARLCANLGIPCIDLAGLSRSRLAGFAGNAMCVPCVGSVLHWVISHYVRTADRSSTTSRSAQGTSHSPPPECGAVDSGDAHDRVTPPWLYEMYSSLTQRFRELSTSMSLFSSTRHDTEGPTGARSRDVFPLPWPQPEQVRNVCGPDVSSHDCHVVLLTANLSVSALNLLAGHGPAIQKVPCTRTRDTSLQMIIGKVWRMLQGLSTGEPLLGCISGWVPLGSSHILHAVVG